MPGRCLWIARDRPFPLDSGDRIYTARMAESLAAAGITVHMLAHADEVTGMNRAAAKLPADWGVELEVVPGGKLPVWRALASLDPLASAVHPTAAYRRQLASALDGEWQLIVIDQLGSVWALDAVLRYRKRHPDCRLIYLSHNHETSLWQGMAERFDGSLPRRIAMRQNAWKAARAERRLSRSVDLITTITKEDAERFGADRQAAPCLALTPGYSGQVRAERVITGSTPRQVILVGSFRWVVKQENLRQFLAVADPGFAQARISLQVVGDVPPGLRAELSANLQATTLHGFVDDLSGLMNDARIAVVPELIGGGFKLKFLDYLFMRLPVATIAAASAGLPTALREQMLQFDDLQSLVHGIIAQIDAIDDLNRRQAQGFELARSHFEWADRGKALLAWLDDSRRKSRVQNRQS